jgi:hypothetical protein
MVLTTRRDSIVEQNGRIEKWKVHGKLQAQTEDEEKSGRMSDMEDIC